MRVHRVKKEKINLRAIWTRLRDFAYYDVFHELKIALRDLTWHNLGVYLILISAAIILFLIVRDFYLVNILGTHEYPDWTGFGDYRGSLPIDQRGKTLWDWLELILVPAALAVVAFWFNRQEKDREKKVQLDRTRESTLQAYFDQMTQLLLEAKLRESEDGSEVRSVARVRTLAALRVLDPRRRTLLLQFLSEANLINKDNILVNLEEAELGGIDFSGNLENCWLKFVNLSNASLGFKMQGINLSHSDLQKTTFFFADLRDSNLEYAHLQGANLWRAQLDSANLEKAELERVFLQEASLENAKLGSADLTRANLENANLKGADLTDAYLTDANLKGANLENTNLSGAIMAGAVLTEKTNLSGATLPSGKIVQSNGK